MFLYLPPADLEARGLLVRQRLCSRTLQMSLKRDRIGARLDPHEADDGWRRAAWCGPPSKARVAAGLLWMRANVVLRGRRPPSSRPPEPCTSHAHSAAAQAVLNAEAQVDKGENARMASFVGAIAVADLVKSTLGPKGMDKILTSVGEGTGGAITITNDGERAPTPTLRPPSGSWQPAGAPRGSPWPAEWCCVLPVFLRWGS